MGARSREGHRYEADEGSGQYALMTFIAQRLSWELLVAVWWRAFEQRCWEYPSRARRLVDHGLRQVSYI